MIAILLIISIIAQVSQQVCRKEYNKTSTDTPFSFSLVAVATTLVYFVVMSKGNVDFVRETLVYAVPFAICYTCAYIFTAFAIEHGPLSLTSLIIACSLAAPLLYGWIMLGEPVDAILILGFILLFMAIVFVSEPWQREGSLITLKWVIYITLTFITNGSCLIILKVFQLADGGIHSNEFMISALAITIVALLAFVLVLERKRIGRVVAGKIILWPLLCGAGNAVANQLTLMLAITLPASILYPIQSAGGIIVTAIVSIVIYREKLSAFQKLGFVLGVAAIVLLNI